MANIFKYADKSAYVADTSRPAHESSVSYDGEGVHYDSKNPLLPWGSRGVAPIGSIVVKDGGSGAKFLIPAERYDSASLDPALKVMDVVKMGDCNGKTIFIHKGISSSLQWAINAMYKIECDTTESGGFDWAITINGAAKTGNVTWSEGATIASIVSQINAVVSGMAVDKTTFVGISVSSYSDSTLTLTNNTGATLTDLTTKCKVGGVLQAETHRTWQSVAVNTLFPSLGFATQSSALYAKNGYNLSYACGANFAKFKAYYSVSGSATYQAESATNHMNKACWDGLAESEVAEQVALYNKYGGDYDAYLGARMMQLDDTHVGGADYLSYDNGKAMTDKLASITTQDLDGNWVCAYPSANYCHNVFVSGDEDFARGSFYMPSVHEVGLFMDDSNFAKINAGLTKIGGTLLSITGYYWSVAEYNGGNAWFYYGGNGGFTSNIKNGASSVRSLLAF